MSASSVSFRILCSSVLPLFLPPSVAKSSHDPVYGVLRGEDLCLEDLEGFHCPLSTVHCLRSAVLVDCVFYYLGRIGVSQALSMSTADMLQTLLF